MPHPSRPLPHLSSRSRFPAPAVFPLVSLLPSHPLPIPLVQLGVWEVCKLPQRGPGRSPSCNASLTILTPDHTSGDNRFSNPTRINIYYKLPSARQLMKNTLPAGCCDRTSRFKNSFIPYGLDNFQCYL